MPAGRSGPEAVTVPAATHRLRGVVLIALGAFQLWLWATRVVNLVQDPEPRTVAFVAVHAVLYGAAFLAAFVLLGLGWRMRREARDVLARTATLDTHAPQDGTLSHVRVRASQSTGPPDTP